MSKRRRSTPVTGSANRIDDRGERLLVRALDLAGGAAAFLLRGLGLRRPPPLEREALRRVAVFRLDRLGDLVMSLPALHDLRQALPRAHVTLVVGRWSREIASAAPVDEVLEWSAPWVGRPGEGTETAAALARKARALRASRLDAAIELQGDVRANLLLALTGARQRVGYANSGGGFLLTRVVALDENVSWVEQNRRAVAALLGPPAHAPRFGLVGEAERDFARRLFGPLQLDRRRPLVGLHASGGRSVKQWPAQRWAEVAARLQREFAATIVLTGAERDRALAAEVARALPERPLDFSGRLGVRETLALIASLDLFLSPDTGPMHLACAAGTRSVSVFGPSDPGRYFSGDGTRQVVVRPELWCSPCNLIRRPPEECGGAEPPECLRLVEAGAVHAAAARLLLQAGFSAGRRSAGAAG
jgi:ADP-heptose:LPS heptosyltransferase